MKCPQLTQFLFFSIVLCLIDAQNDLNTIFEKTADWFKEFLPKNAPTLASLPFIPPTTPKMSLLNFSPIFPTPPPISMMMSMSKHGYPPGISRIQAPISFPTFPPLPTFPTPKPFPTLPTSNFTFPPLSANSMKMLPPVNITLDPEALMSVPEIVTHWGYPVEEYNVVTKDGYILTLHRIPYGRNETRSKKLRPVVFLQHGLLCTSSIWLLNLPSQSAGFVFADAGFDVWLGNMRGNTYSKSHLRMDHRDAKYWRFSWEEMARYDLEAMVDGILNVTKQKQLYFIGHSQGTLTMFAKLVLSRGFAGKIRKFFALAPVARLVNVKGMFHTLGETYPQFKLFYEMIGDKEFLPNNIFTRLLTDVLCDRKMKNPLCEDFIYQVSGPDSNQLNKTRIGIYLAHNPAGTSWKNIIHYAQMVKSGKMRPFDYGADHSMKLYGRTHPPEFDLSQVEVPLYLFYSDADWLATSNGVEGFILKMIDQKYIKLSKKLSDFNHNDFLWGLRAREEIYDVIVNVISLDHRKFRIQDGVRRYLEAKSNLSPNSTSDSFLENLLRE
ncbi:unnamed protein product, partial [Mesorhabditis belari]|uniref:Partial AB-hydrolase lipase domain-containing protein n=1 Tax=Mesorhabditis belari TaxID=2138241 RepID=A0AAF3JBH8_9BILA